MFKEIQRKIHGNSQKPLETDANSWKYKKLGKFKEISRKGILQKFMENDRYLKKFMEIRGNLRIVMVWKLMENHGNLWEVYGK